MPEKTWDEEKQYWKQRIKDLEVPPDIKKQNIHYLEHELDKAYQEASFKYTYYETRYENIKDTIKAIRKEHASEGANDRERDANAYKMVLYYPHGNPELKDEQETTNLIEVRNNIRKKFYFYRDYVMDNLKTKSDRLKTAVGASKIEAQIGGGYGTN
jgi:hypothetical protein